MERKSEVTGTQARRRRSGSSAQERSRWRATYENSRYDELPWFDPGPSPQVVLAVDTGFFTRGMEILDVGCGAGSNVLYLARSGFRASGVDLSIGAVTAARSRISEAHLDARIDEGDVLALPFPAGSFDGLIDNGCFHTIPLRRRGRYADEVHRVLRPGGAFVLSWVAREHTSPMGPPHRPSLREVVTLLESRFLFLRTGFRSASDAAGPSAYFAFLRLRTEPYPPAR